MGRCRRSCTASRLNCLRRGAQACSSRQYFEPRERRAGRAASRFSWWLICDESRRLAGDTTKEVPASCLLPQKSGARLLRSFVHPRVRRQPGRCLLRPAAQTRLSPTTRSRKSLVARTASAWPALLVQRGSFRDRRTAFRNKARPTAVAPSTRPASLSTDPILGSSPPPNTRGERLALCLVPDVR